MANPKVKVTYVDGREREVIVGPKAQVETERKFGLAFQDCGNLEHYYYAAWAALKAAGREAAEFDVFLEALHDVENAGQAEVDPTQKAQPSGSTSG